MRSWSTKTNNNRHLSEFTGRSGRRNLRDSLENIASAGDLFATPRQRTLARQALGVPGMSRAGFGELGEAELLEALAGAL